MKYKIIATRPNCQCGKCEPLELIRDTKDAASAEVQALVLDIVFAGMSCGMLLVPDQSKTTEGNFHCDFMRENPHGGPDVVEVTITASPIHLH